MHLSGKVLNIDLSSRHCSASDIDQDFRMKYLGGRGINSRLLFDETHPGIDPLSPENVLIVGTGAINRADVPGACRYVISAKSPLTGILGDANAGSRFGMELKRAGYDHIVIKGAADTPVYIFMDGPRVEIRDARHLWGKTVWDTQEAIKMELGADIQVICIGEGGENLVRYACVINGLANANGRTGMGAVMGSKKLKAIAVKGSAKFETAHPDRLNAWRKELGASIRKSPVYLLRSKYGTLPTFAGQDSIGTLSVKNLSDVKVPEGRNLYHGAFAKNLTGINSCPGCFVHCKHDTQIVNGPYAGEKGGVVEFGSTAGLGANCGNYDADAVIKLTNVCNQYGIDVTETGYVLGYVMDWYEHGLLSVQDTDGIELKWGDWQAMLAMIHKIAHRQGFGNILAEGPLRVAKQVGKGAETYISHCKGLTRGGSPDARPFKGLALSYGTATRGACHMRGLPWIERATLGWVADDVRQRTREQFGTDDVMYPTSYNKAGVVVHYQDMATIADSLGICKFYTAVGGGTMELGEMAELCQIIFGVDVDKEELKQIAARIYNVERAFLVREGCTKNDDYLSGKYSSEPMPSGPFKGERLDKAKYTEMLEEYYRLRGWDLITGAPTKMTLDQLGIGDLLPTVDSPS